MNLILLSNEQLKSDGIYIPDERQMNHIKDVHRANIGDELVVGEVNGKIGKAIVVEHDSNLALRPCFDTPPPSKLPVHLILALPRPKMLKRIIQTATTLGVEKITFLNSYRVEKSYWQTPLLNNESLLENAILGLEQAQDTVLPTFCLEKRFKPYIEDVLPNLIKGTRALVAHPYSQDICPVSLNEKTTLVIGPEGGFIPYEIEKLIDAGCQGVNIGERILRVETAVPTLLGRLFT